MLRMWVSSDSEWKAFTKCWHSSSTFIPNTTQYFSYDINCLWTETNYTHTHTHTHTEPIRNWSLTRTLTLTIRDAMYLVSSQRF